MWDSQRGLPGLAPVAQQHGGECLSQRAAWGLITVRLSLISGSQTRGELCLAKYAKQAGSKWLKICLFELLFK